MYMFREFLTARKCASTQIFIQQKSTIAHNNARFQLLVLLQDETIFEICGNVSPDHV